MKSKKGNESKCAKKIGDLLSELKVMNWGEPGGGGGGRRGKA